jgi:hypothetical protein
LNKSDTRGSSNARSRTMFILVAEKRPVACIRAWNTDVVTVFDDEFGLLRLLWVCLRVAASWILWICVEEVLLATVQLMKDLVCDGDHQVKGEERAAAQGAIT